jgi:hypothetical protein
MSAKDTEDVLEAIQTQLDSNLGSSLDAIDAEKNDGILLDDVVDIYIYAPGLVDRFPAIILAPTPPARHIEESAMYDLRVVGVSTFVLLVGNKGELDLWRRTYRTMRGVIDVILADRTLGDEVDDCMVVSENYEPGIPYREGAESGVMAIGAIDMIVRLFP